MSAEKEFALWLRRPEQSMLQNFQFALKSWQSADFTLSSKYEVVLRWLAEVGAQAENPFPAAEYIELLQLRAPPGLVDQQVKRDFVKMMLSIGDSWQHQNKEVSETRQIAEVLHKLNDFEPLQDLLRFDYELHASIYATLLQNYNSYLLQLESVGKEIRLEQETIFFASILKSLLENAKSAGDLTKFEHSYTALVLQPLTEVILVMRKHNLCFSQELLSIENLLTEAYKEMPLLLNRALNRPLHVSLLTLECAIVNRRGDQTFLKQLFFRVFEKELNIEGEEDKALTLNVAAHTLEMLRKHDVNMSFQLNGHHNALSFVGIRLLLYVQTCKESHLREVLMLLCAAVRLNPLILEQQVFQITTWMIVATKADQEEQNLFEEYLVLLVDMFRRLSRAEKFVANLLKALTEYVHKFELPQRGKRKLKDDSVISVKKQKGQNVVENNSKPTDVSENYYLKILFEEFSKKPSNLEVTKFTSATTTKSFPQLYSHWPSSTVGVAFSKLITSLMTKPSLVIWKTLIYSLKQLLESVAQTVQLDESTLLLLDLNAAWLCQYFAGSRLSEQFEKFASEIDEQRKLTSDVFALFGRTLLACEHSQRTMSAFLECSFYVANFELLLAYYRPDGNEQCVPLGVSSMMEQPHSFLATHEWTLIHQRVLNFGKINCKFLLNRLLLQRTQPRLLFNTTVGASTTSLGISKLLLSPVCNDPDQLVILLTAPSTKWLVTTLSRDEKIQITKVIWNKPELHAALQHDLELLELILIALFEDLCTAFATNSKNSLLSTLQCNFDSLRKGLDQYTAEKHTQQLIEQINLTSEYKLKKYPHEEAQTALLILRQLPIGHLRRQAKCVVFTLLLAFYRDLKAAQVHDSAVVAIELITDLLHFGQHLPIFKYFPTASILNIFPIESCWELYELLFANIKNDEKGTDLFLVALAEILRNAAQQNEGKLNDDQRRLLLIAIESLSAIVGPSAERMRKMLDNFLEIYAVYVNSHFATENSAKKDKKFVDLTLAGFAPYASNMLAKENRNEQQAGTATVDEHFRRVCKIYIGHSMDYRNPHGVSLMQVALQNRQKLHLDQDEIELVLSGYWRQLNEDLKSPEFQQQTKLKAKTTEHVVKMIIGHKTNEDLLLTLKDIVAHLDRDCTNVMRLLALIAKCPLTTIKGAIFNEHIKHIMCDITLRLAKDAQQQFLDAPQLLSILLCQLALVENKIIAITIDTLDSVLAFLMDINIKKFNIDDTNVRCFHSLHLAMSDVCAALLKQRHVLLMDRMPQFMQIFKDLLQSIVLYKSERQKDTVLSATELDDLAELALKLEALMHIIAMHSVALKRVAPFVLTFVIDLMVTSKRPTTLYPKIKTHIESICYDLIGICDHRVGRFILRCSNEASRQIYELLVKEHKKYHKFKGKV